MYWDITIGIIIARIIELAAMSLISAAVKTAREYFSKSTFIDNDAI